VITHKLADWFVAQIAILLRGFGQIIFQASAVSGFVFLVAIAVNSSTMLLGSLVGTLCSSFSARLFGADPEAIRQGLYGYNGGLIGLSIMLFYRADFTSLGLIAMAAICSSLLLSQISQRLRWLPPLTAPFLLMAWLVFAGAEFFGLVPLAAAPLVIETNPVVLFFRGYGQMLFQANALSGLLLLIGVALHSKADAAWAMFGVAVAMVLVALLDLPASSATEGFYSFSAALIAIALSNKVAVSNKMTVSNKAALADKLVQVMIVTAGVILAVLLTRLGQFAGFTALTAPFVGSTWLIIALVFTWRKRSRP